MLMNIYNTNNQTSMNKEDILIKRIEDPLLNISWHTSPIGRTSNSCFRNIYHLNTIINDMKCLLKIIDPSRYEINVDTYKQKRDESTLNHHKIHFHNKIKSLFNGAYNILHNMSNEDANYFDLNKEFIKEILDQKRDEYEVDSYKRKLLKKL
jgi:hypothetical protein